MRVDEALSFAEYWNDPRFLRKRPDLAGSRKMAFGDNIYRRDGTGEWKQLDSHHSMHDGSANPLNIAADTRVDRVLVSQDFIYWGDTGPQIPDHLCAFGPDEENVCSLTQGHRCRFSDQMVTATVQWMDDFDQRGLQGRPRRWPQS
jgi:Nucleotide modification associated domain 2